MKRSIISGLVAIASFASLVWGQENDVPAKRIARVIGEMERPHCEGLQAAMDKADSEITNNPGDVLYAVIHPGKAEKPTGYGYGAQVGAWMKRRGFDPSRITIAFGPEREVASLELIAVPPGADEPKTERLWVRRSTFADAEIPRKAKLIVTETEEEGPCFSDNRALEDLGVFLKENAAARVRIVVKVYSAREFNDEAQAIRKTLSTEYGVATGRVRIVHVRTAAWPKAPTMETEYWLLPKPQVK